MLVFWTLNPRLRMLLALAGALSYEALDQPLSIIDIMENEW